LGVVDRDVIFRLADAILNRDVPAALSLIDEVYDHGHNLKELYGALLEHFRNLLVVRMSREAADLVDATDQERRRMAQSVREVSETHLSQLLDVLFREEATIRYSAQPRIALEMACFRMFQLRPSLPIETLIQKLDGLSRGVLTEAELERPDPLDVPSPPVRPQISADGRGTAPAGTEPGASASTDSGRAAADSAPTSVDSSPVSEPGPTQAVHEKSEPAAVSENTSASHSVRPPSKAPAPAAAPGKAGKSVSVSASETVESASNKPVRSVETAASTSSEGLGEETEMPSAPAHRQEVGYSAADSGDGHRVSEDVPAAEAAPAVGAPSEAAPSMETGSDKAGAGESMDINPTGAAPDVSGESVEPVGGQTAAPAGPNGDGDAILERAAAQVPESLSSLLRKCKLTSVEPGALQLEINAADFHIKRLKKQERTLQKIFSDVTGSSVRLTLKKGVESGGPATNRAAEANRRREEALNHPLVAAAMEIFEGTLVDVKPLSEE
jgi:DNA polymerase-3 subunit gamma/tau